MSKDNSQTFMDAQLAFAKSKQGRAQKKKDKHGYRYQQIKQAARQVQAQDADDNGKEDE